MQRVCLLVESFDFMHVRRADQAAIQRVGPRVIGALDRFRQPAPRGFAESRAAMAADIVIRAPLAGLVAQDDDALTGDLRQHVIAWICKSGISADADPVVLKDALLLCRKNLRRRVVAAGERARALLITLDRLQEGRHRSAPLRFLENDPRGITAGRAGDPAARMRARTAQIQPVQRRAVAAPTGYWAHEENLVESKLSVVEVPLGRIRIQLIGALQHEP